MSIRTFGLLAAVTAVGLLSVGAASSSAATYLHDNATSGSLLPGGTTITPRPATGDIAAFTLPGFGTLSCSNNTFSATVGASGGATITGTLDSLTFTECTDTVPGLTYSSCHLVNGTPTLTITATSHNGGTIAMNDVTMKCYVGPDVVCYYTAATATGLVNNTGATLAYANVGIVHSTGPGDLGAFCGNTMSLSTTFTDLTSGGTGRTVVLNQTA